MTSSGTEASMSAIRLARAATGRDRIVKFAGAYHGHVDGLLAEAGSGLATQGIPASPGVTEAQAADTVVVPWNDRRVEPRSEAAAAIICEPYPANMGLVPPAPGLPSRRCASTRTATGALLDLRRGDHGLPRRPRRSAGAGGGDARPHRARQGHRRRPAGGGVRGARVI